MHSLASRLSPAPSTSPSSVASLCRPPPRRFPSSPHAATLKRAGSRTLSAVEPPLELRRGPTLARRPSRKASRSGARCERKQGGQERSLEETVDAMEVMDLIENLEGEEELGGWREAVDRELTLANEKLLEYIEKEYGRRIACPRDLVDQLVREGAVAEPTRFNELLAEKGFVEDQLKKRSDSTAAYEAVFVALVETAQLTAESLSLFRTLPVTKLKLKLESQTYQDSVHAGVGKSDALLSTVAAPNSFHSLTRLDLSSIAIPQHSLQLLSNLSLLKLNLNTSGTTIEGIACLVPLAPTLQALHLATNSAVDDDGLPLLSLFSLLISLDLTGTSTTQPGLRSFVVKAREAQPQLLQIAPPAAVQDYVTSLLVPAPVFESKITEPSQVSELSSADLLKNYKGWQAKGWVKSHKERQAKMEAFLRSREDDIRCKKLMSEENATIARVWEE